MPEKNFRKENFYSTYQCFFCLCYCTLPQTASDFAQLKALTVVLKICVFVFFSFFPIVLRPCKFPVYDSQEKNYSSTSVEESIKTSIERNKVSTFLLPRPQSSSTCRYFTNEALQYLHTILVPQLLMTGFILFPFLCVRRSTVCGNTHPRF